MNKNLLILLTALLFSCFSCAGKQDDPLKHSRKLVKKGHASLYNNGAFKVPNSSICLIPPGPDTMEFVMELAIPRAREAFLKSLKKASESVYIVSEGTKLTFKAAGKSRKTGQDVADFIRNHSREGSVWLLDKSFDKGKNLIGASWVFPKTIQREMDEAVRSLVEKTDRMGDSLSENGTQNGKAMITNSLAFSGEFYRDRREGTAASMEKAKVAVIRGYAVLPDKLKQNKQAAGENLDKANFSNVVKQQNTWRQSWSGKSRDLVIETLNGYTDDVQNTFAKAGDELSGCYTTGIPLASLKALRWVLQSLFWDAALEPLTKITTGGLGYIGVNCMAFPVVVIEEEGRALAQIAVDVGWNTSKSAYQLTAPCGEAALAGIYGLLEYSTGPVFAATATAGGAMTGAATVGASKTGGMVVKGGGRAAGIIGQYIGVPLASAGVVTTGTVSGLAVMSGGAMSSGTLFVSGETTAAGSDVFGNIIAGTTAVTGTAVSTGLGASYGVYQLSKAVIVPSGYEIGSGVVLSYETMSQISAQSILAVSDCAYLVLSLEGPRWVLYAVKGNLGKGEDLVPGTVLDLKTMQANGEEIYNLPVSDQEMKEIVTSTSTHLPYAPADLEKPGENEL